MIIKDCLFQKSSTVDPFVLYGNEYKDIRQAVALSLCGSDVAELQATVRVRNISMHTMGLC